MKVVYLGICPEPARLHGDTVEVCGFKGEIHQRELRGATWWYAMLPHDRVTTAMQIFWFCD